MLKCFSRSILLTRYLHTTATLHKTFYEALGVPRNATAKQIKAAYFDLAKKCHPDVSSAAQSTVSFQEISKAYQVLSDSEKRAEYNGSLDYEEVTFKADAYWEESAESTFKSAFGVNFDEIFRGRFGYKADLENQREYILGISMAEAALGSPKYIEINTHQRCVHCQGYGCGDGKAHSRVQCRNCYGGGRVPCDSLNFGWLDKRLEKRESAEMPCGECNGKGYRISEPCSRCRGVGRTNIMEWHPVTVPPGVKHGQVISAPGIDGAPMHITIAIMNSTDGEFGYDNQDNITSTIHVHYSTLIQGGCVIVETVGRDEYRLQVPPNTQPGTVIPLEGVTPPHTYTVGLFLPNPDNVTTHMNDTYRALLDMEHEHVTSLSVPYGINYRETTELKSLTRFQLFRNDLYFYTVVPVYRLFIMWPLRELYYWAKRNKRCRGFVKMVETSSLHTAHFPPNVKNII